MGINNICMGCMEEKGDSKVCPKCGWVEGTEAESPLHLKPGTVLKEQYLIGKVLGHGGFGITYLASDINLGAKLAIKEYFPQGMATRNTGDATISVYSGNTKEHFEYGLEKFLEEARTLAKFDDIHEIVTAKDFFKENGTAYLVMSYIEGITLQQYLQQNGGKLPLDAVLNIMLPIMKALETVHKAGILHRDISPDNIYITKNFNVKLLDFGAARYAVGEHSKSLSIILKPGYAPEEQYRSKGRQGPWTDVYAVGATMYKALTGETPPEALDRLDNDIIIKPTDQGIELNENFENALMKALSVKAAARFQSIGEFETELIREIPTDIQENDTKKGSSQQEERDSRIKDKDNDNEKDNAEEKNLEDNTDKGAVKEDTPSMHASEYYLKNSDKAKVETDINSQFDLVGSFSEKEYYIDNSDNSGTKIRKNNNWIYFILLLIIVSVFVYLATSKTYTQKPENTTANTQGNTNGNLVNSGFVAQQGNWIYYNNRNDDYYIYKIKTDGSGRQKLSDDSSYNINVSGDWIYYENREDGLTIYKVKTDGSGRQKLNDDRSDDINVSGDWIYYSNKSDDYKLYKIKTDGRSSQKLSDDSSEYINVSGDWIYYENRDDSLTIYKVKIDGSGRKKLTDDPSEYINVSGDWIYYGNRSDNDKIYKIKTDGSSRQKLNDDNSSFINVSGDWIYYGNDGDNGKLYKIKTDGSGRQKLSEDKSWFINISDDWIYYGNGSDNDKIYKIKTDGSSRQLVK